MEFHIKRLKEHEYKVIMSGTINDGMGQREVDFGLWDDGDKMFVNGGKLYIVDTFLWHYTEWFLYRYHDTGVTPVLWRVDPYTGEREVLVSFDTGKFIIENPPKKVASRNE